MGTKVSAFGKMYVMCLLIKCEIIAKETKQLRMGQKKSPALFQKQDLILNS